MTNLLRALGYRLDLALGFVRGGAVASDLPHGFLQYVSQGVVSDVFAGNNESWRFLFTQKPPQEGWHKAIKTYVLHQPSLRKTQY